MFLSKVLLSSNDLDLESVALLRPDCMKANVSSYIPSHRWVITFVVGAFTAAKHKAMLNDGQRSDAARGQDAGLQVLMPTLGAESYSFC